MKLMNDMLPKVAAYLDGRDWNDVPAMQDRKFTVRPLALYRQHGSKLRQLHCEPAAGNDSSGRLGDAQMGRSIPGPVSLLFSTDNLVENKLENGQGGQTQIFKSLQPASAGSAFAGYVAGPGKTARSLCLPARNLLVGHGLGSLSDPVFRYEKPGYLGQAAAIHGPKVYSLPV